MNRFWRSVLVGLGITVGVGASAYSRNDLLVVARTALKRLSRAVSSRSAERMSSLALIAKDDIR
jgi:hypothetical protein